MRGTIGGDQVNYPGITTAYTAHLESIRVMLNATVSENARIATADIKDFYLGTPLDRPEYMRISLKHIPLDVQLRYEIAAMVENEYVIMEITKGPSGWQTSSRSSSPTLGRPWLQPMYQYTLSLCTRQQWSSIYTSS